MTDAEQLVEWKHQALPRNRTPLIERWEHWFDPEWRWLVQHSVPRILENDLQKVVNQVSPYEEEEHWTWSVSFQGGDERWHGADQWLVGGVCFSEEEAKAACERVGPAIYGLWASLWPRKN